VQFVSEVPSQWRFFSFLQVATDQPIEPKAATQLLFVSAYFSLGSDFLSSGYCLQQYRGTTVVPFQVRGTQENATHYNIRYSCNDIPGAIISEPPGPRGS